MFGVYLDVCLGGSPGFELVVFWGWQRVVTPCRLRKFTQAAWASGLVRNRLASAWRKAWASGVTSWRLERRLSRVFRFMWCTCWSGFAVMIWRCIKTVRLVPRTVSLRMAYQQEWLLRRLQW